MEVFFADVGQGTSNIILLGDRKAIVIDGGRRGQDVITLLHHLQVDYLSMLVVSHNDADHSGGAAALLRQFRHRLARICFLQDHKLLDTRFWKVLWEEFDNGHLSLQQLVRLECEDQPAVLHSDPQSGLMLKVLAPRFGANLLALRRKNANATSGVIVLNLGRSRIVFPGDATIDEWKAIHHASGQRLECNILCVPHHAGLIHNNLNDLDWLYTEAVRPHYAIVSAGTTNSFAHPREDVVTKLRSVGSIVLCTQITARCCSDLEVMVREGLPIVHPGRSKGASDINERGERRDVACAGTILAQVTSEGVAIDRIDEHQKTIDRLATMSGSTAIPLCRRQI